MHLSSVPHTIQEWNFGVLSLGSAFPYLAPSYGGRGVTL